MFNIVKKSVSYSWKRTGPEQCHRICFPCQYKISYVKKNIINLNKKYIMYKKESIQDHLLYYHQITIP